MITDKQRFAAHFRKLLDTHLPDLKREAQRQELNISLSQIYNYLGARQIPRDLTLDNICNGLTLSDDQRREFIKLCCLARAKGGTKDEQKRLYAGEAREGKDTITLVREGRPRVPIYEIAAGETMAFDDAGYPVGVGEHYLSVPKLTDPHAFGCFVHGDSMSPEYNEGDMLVFSPALEVRDGDVCFIRTDELATVKRIFFEDSMIRLAPSNPKHPPHWINRADVRQLWRLHSFQRKYEPQS